MAKRKKLNKRVVTLLIALGTVMLAGVVLAVIHYSPRDHNAESQIAREARKNADYKKADLHYRAAIGAIAKDKEQRDVRATYYFELGEMTWNWALNAADMPQTERHERAGKSREYVAAALRDAPKMEPAHRLMCEILWNFSRSRPAKELLNDNVVELANNDFIEGAGRLLELAPQDHKTYYRRGIAYAHLAKTVGRENVDKSVADFRKAIELKPSEILYWVRLTELYELLDRREQIEPTYKEALLVNSDSAELRVQYAEYLRQQNRLQDAQDQISEAARRSPNDPTGKLAQATIFLAQTKTNEALASLEEARKIDPQDPRSYLVLSQVYLQMREQDKSIEILRQGVEALGQSSTTAPSGDAAKGAANQKTVTSRLVLTNALANAILDKATTDREKQADLVAEARKLYEGIVSLIEGTPHKDKLEGRLALADNKRAEALQLLERANQGFGGEDRHTLALLVGLYRRQNMPTKAEHLLDSLLALPEQRNNTSLLIQRASLDLENREFAAAADRLKQVLALEPQNEEAGNMILAMEFLAKDSTALPAELKLTPEIIRLLSVQATERWERGERQQALGILESLVQRAPGALDPVRRLATYYASTERVQQGVALLEQAAALHKDDAELQAQLADMTQLLGTNMEERYTLRMAMADKIADPLSRALQKASIAMGFNKEAEALQFMQEAQQINPKSPTVIQQMFGYCVGKKDYEGAGKWAQTAIEQNVDQVNGRLFTAQLAMAQGQNDKAITLLTAVISERPDLKAPRLLLGDTYRNDNKLDKAEQAFRSLLEYDRSYEPALVRLAQLMAQMGRQAEATQFIDRAYQAGTRNLWILENRMRLADRNDPAKAIQQRQELFAQNPNDLGNAVYLANLYDTAGDKAKAEELYRLVYDKSPNKLAAAEQMGAFFAKNNRASDVDSLFNQLVASGQVAKADAYLAYARAVAVTDMQRALEIAGKAIEADPKNALVWGICAGYFAQSGQWQKAADNMAKAIELQSDLAQKPEYWDMIQWRINGQQYDQAQALLDASAGRSASLLEPKLLRTRLAVARGDMTLAQNIASDAIRDHPSDATPLAMRAEIYRAAGDLDRARADLEAATKLSPSLEIGTQLAEVYLTLFEREKARLAYTDVYRRQATYRPAVQGLLDIYMQDANWSALEAMLGDVKKAFPSDPQYLVQEAEMWKQRHDDARRLAALEGALKLDDNYLPAVINYLMTLLDTKQFDMVIQRAKDLPNKPQLKVAASVFSASAMFAQQKPAEAQTLFLAALKEAPPEMVRFVLQRISEAYGPKETAAHSAELAAAQPGLWQLQHALISVCEQGGDYKAAEQFGIKAMELAKQPQDRATVQTTLGTLYLQMHDRKMSPDALAKSEALLVEAYKVLPNDIRVVNNLAYLYVTYKNDSKSGLPYARRAASLMPNANVLDTYGWTLAQLGQLDEAESQLLRAVRIDEKLPAARYHLGWVYEQKSRISDAGKQYRQGLEMVGQDDPMHKLISEALQRVQR